MNIITRSDIYVLDTNILIGLSLWLPMSLNKAFWSKFEDALQIGDWVLLDVVVKEIKYDGDLKSWCEKKRKAGLVKMVSDNHKDRSVEINNKYKMIDDITFKSTVDTYLIAYAESNNLIVFTRESHRRSNKELYKIPDVCDILKIRHISEPRKFMESIGYKN